MHTIIIFLLESGSALYNMIASNLSKIAAVEIGIWLEFYKTKKKGQFQIRPLWVVLFQKKPPNNFYPNKATQ